MSEKTCGTCRFWNNNWRRWSNRSKYGRCTKVEQGNENDAPNEELAFVNIEENCIAEILCLTTFGCVLWEKKETENE